MERPCPLGHRKLAAKACRKKIVFFLRMCQGEAHLARLGLLIEPTVVRDLGQLDAFQNAEPAWIAWRQDHSG